MRIIYKIREEFTGDMAEDIAITFKDGDYVKMVRVPMDAYLAHATQWTNLTLEGFSKDTDLKKSKLLFLFTFRF